ncbi:MAG: SigE family RNA polymerase sigma factor [Propionibacteriaceae bacterium]|nr:SigE family RNA polymerase sigma factor [Propionibacteriaceae bacterium]
MSPPLAVQEARVEVVVGEGRDFDRFVAEHGLALQHFAYLVIGDAEDAHDAVQDALLGAFRSWPRIVADRDPGAYIRRSIVNAHISRWRKRRRELMTDDVLGAVAADTDRVVDSVYLSALLERLPVRQRAAVVLRYFEDREFADIGGVLGCSPATARSLVHRALAQLRQAEGRDRA